jgi:hypothetical protein
MTANPNFIPDIQNINELDRAIDKVWDTIEALKNQAAWEALNPAYTKRWTMVADKNAEPGTIEWKLWFALAAYESVLTRKNRLTKKTTYAARLRQKIKRVGILKTVSDAVRNGPNSPGFQVLADWRRLDASFEKVVVTNPQHFPNDLVDQAKASLMKYE